MYFIYPWLYDQNLGKFILEQLLLLQKTSPGFIWTNFCYYQCAATWTACNSDKHNQQMSSNCWMGLPEVVQRMVVVTPVNAGTHRLLMCLIIAKMLLMGATRSNNLIATEIWRKMCKSLALWMLGRRRLSSYFLQLLLLMCFFSWTCLFSHSVHSEILWQWCTVLLW